MQSIRTDLAIEAASIFNKSKEDIDALDGIDADIIKDGSCVISRVKITNENGAKTIGKPIGNYITIDCPNLKDGEDEYFNEASRLLNEELDNVLKNFDYKTVLVVGLGNWNVTPDALGPKVISNICVTRHMEEKYGVNSVCAISPGVLGITGIETSEIIKGVCEKTNPDLVIAIDALASRKMERICTTFQLCDTGIVPGSGIGNKRKEITKDFLGVPVIASGVPTVVDAATVANDTMEILINTIKNYADDDSNIKKSISVFENEKRYDLIKEVLSPYVGELIVTPKEVDTIIDHASKIIANSINTILVNEMIQLNKL